MPGALHLIATLLESAQMCPLADWFSRGRGCGATRLCLSGQRSCLMLERMRNVIASTAPVTMQRAAC